MTLFLLCHIKFAETVDEKCDLFSCKQWLVPLSPMVVPEGFFDYRKNHGHLYEVAILDVLMKVIDNGRKRQNADADMQEMLMSNLKL